MTCNLSKEWDYCSVNGIDTEIAAAFLYEIKNFSEEEKHALNKLLAETRKKYERRRLEKELVQTKLRAENIEQKLRDMSR